MARKADTTQHVALIEHPGTPAQRVRRTFPLPEIDGAYDAFLADARVTLSGTGMTLFGPFIHGAFEFNASAVAVAL